MSPKERGIALIAGLLLMTVLSMVVLISVSGMILQRQMASNLHDSTLALENAAHAEAFAIAWLNSRADHEREAACHSDCVLPVGILNSGSMPAQPEFESLAWWRDHAMTAGYDPASGEPVGTLPADKAPALWLAEEIHHETTGDPAGDDSAEAIAYYRILSRGTDTKASSIAVTEAIVARPWGGNYHAAAFPATDGIDRFCSQFAVRYDCGLLAWRQRR
ncbi:MAG: pilus assembly PilX N-terminal domain-containing protein [Xanthomonadales bacterium]|nr:pilus assembly PilX N-terminal domain-containing protein [Xanthomonadales bacterium]